VTKFYQVLYDLIDFITTDERVCPKPFLWSDLYRKMKQESSDRGITTKISLPLILAAWRGSTDAQKRQRLVEQIKFSDSHDFLSVVDLFLRSIPDGDWYRHPETGQQNIPEWVRKEKLQRNLSTKVTILGDELEKLKLFLDEHDHLRIPANYIDNDGFELGRWVRNSHNNFKNSKLNLDQVKELESLIGSEWDPK
jgi:hypothetical protein